MRLQLQIALWRHGFIWLLPMVAAVTATFMAVGWWPHVVQIHSAEKADLTRLQNEQEKAVNRGVTPKQASTEDVLFAQIGQVVYAESEISDVLRQLNKTAKSHGLVIAQSEFQSTNEGHAGLQQQQLIFPLRTSYPQLRQFIEEVLLILPGISVDQLILKRESVAQNQADVRLKLSIWIDPKKSVKAAP